MSILVTRSSLPEFAEYAEEIKPLWDSAWLTNMGVKHKTLEAELKEYLGAPNLSLLVNGHMALELTLQAFHLRGEVITTPFTFASTTHAIVRNGLKPVFCDIRESDFTIDPDLIESLITPETTAIVPVHVYGNICDVERIEAIAKKHGLRVIYDAAHAFGEKKEGVGVAAFGDASIFSFHATKVFHTIEGGAAVFQDAMIGKRLYNLKNFGIQSEEVVDAVGANAKMNEFCAAMGICNLRHVDGEIAKRRAVVERYRERLGKVSGIRVKETQAGVQDNYAYFPIIVDEKVFPKSRNDIYEELKRHDIYSRKYFFPLTCDFDCYRERFAADHLSVARKISRRVLCLPLSASLPLESVDRICDIILSE